jgi:hypothetical protein
VSAQAKRGYEGYAASTGGKTFDGRDMPKWDELPERIREAWRAAIAAAIDTPAKKETLTDVQVRLLHESQTAAIGRKLKEMLPSDQGFILLTCDYGSGGNLAYIATIDREDAIRVLREWLTKHGALGKERP